MMPLALVAFTNQGRPGVGEGAAASAPEAIGVARSPVVVARSPDRATGPTEGLQGLRTLPERRIRELQIRAIEEIESLQDHRQPDVLGDVNAPAQPQVERSEIKPYPGVAPYADGTVIRVCVAVSVTTGLNIEGQRRSISEDIAQLESVDSMSPPCRVRLRIRRGQCAAHCKHMPLIVVGPPAVIAQTEIILRREEEGGARIVNRLRKRIRNTESRPASEAPVERHSHRVVVRITGAFVTADITKARVWAAEVRYPKPRCVRC